MKKPSKSFLDMAEIYKRFAEGWDNLELSSEALQEMYEYETYGKGNLKSGVFGNGKVNGYAHGKRMLNLTVSEWQKDTRDGLLFVSELYCDWYPHWWLNSIFGRTKPPLQLREG